MSILASLPMDMIATLGLATQVICGIGVYVAGKWRALLLYAVLLPLFWFVPFMLASGHLVAAVDGILYLPVAFLGAVCCRAARATKDK
jgi:hypothetical protein